MKLSGYNFRRGAIYRLKIYINFFNIHFFSLILGKNQQSQWLL